MGDDISKKEDSVDQYFSYSDSYKAKDLIWDAYYGFVENFNVYSMYRSSNRKGSNSYKGLVRYSVGLYNEIRNFLDKIYPKGTKVKELERLNKLFNTMSVKLEDADILFLSRFFGDFMVDSGIKNVLYLKDTKKPGEKFMADRYPDVEKSKTK